MRSLFCDVLRSANGYDCTKNGISARYKNIYILTDEGTNSFDEDNIPENTFVVVTKNFGYKEYSCLVPYHLLGVYKSNKLPIMFGGNFAFTSDSRFPSDYPLPIHDRVESWDEYNSYD